MDEAYANDQKRLNNPGERQTLDNINMLTPDFEKYYDAFIDLRDKPSISKEEQEQRIRLLEERLIDIRRTLDENEDSEEKSLYLHFVGHGGHSETVDEIQHIHYDYLFNKLYELFNEYDLTVNLLGTCYSIFAKNYMRKGTLLCCSKTTLDYLSPFQYTSFGFYKTEDLEGFIAKCGNSGGYEIIRIP